MTRISYVLPAFLLMAGMLSAQGLQPGDKAPDFNLKNVDGKMVSLSGYPDARGVILVFTCNSCPYAVAYEDRLLALDKKFAPLGYPVIAINPSDPEAASSETMEKMKQRAASKGFTFPYLQDEGQQVYPTYGATKTPHVFVLQKDKKEYVVRYIGAIDDNYRDAGDVSDRYVEQAVEALLAGKALAQATTVAIGCGIKVKK
jgi:peroxiredoxin